ncbi:MAG: phosphatase PAP2 family protein [Mesorhizobium sp.]|nr:phosphatase PAP2 family protein [Mesorhizobium sp.]MBN9241595.1 phosphatase PAP2 family protein [Mesorhizobium sp.]
MDAALTHWLNAPAGSNAPLDALALAFTSYGVPAMVLIVALQWWAPGDRRHTRHVAVTAGLSFLAGLAINQLVLLFVHRVRPYDAGVSHLLIPPSVDWSFPSDHATASFAIVAAFAAQAMPRRALLFLVLALAVCWSRIYVGTHYVTDVLGGLVTAIVGAILVRMLYRRDSRLDALLLRIF